jgi:hypothetical protein
VSYEKDAVDRQIESKTTIQFIVKTSSFYIIMLHVSAIKAIIRQNLYKNLQRKGNTDVARGTYKYCHVSVYMS